MSTGRMRIGLLLTALVALAAQLACTRPDAAQGATDPCAQAPTPGESEVAVLSSGIERTAVVDVPRAPAGQRLPVLVGLHGAGAKFFQTYSGFTELVDGEHFIAVYPNPIDKADGHTFWNINDQQPEGGPNDVQFIADLLTYLESDLCIDTSRIYAAGVSNGGGMAARLACELSERFAGFASIAGGYSSLPPCDPTNPVSVIEIHGTADTVVPYNGKPPNGAGAVWPWLWAWHEHDACRGAPMVSRIAPRAERYEWSACAEGSKVEHVEIYGGGHQLPGGLPPDAGQSSTVSAAWLAWSFLREHQLAAPYGTATQARR